MNRLSLNARKIEFLVYGIIWLLVFSVPFFNEPYFNERTFVSINWGHLIYSWIQLLSFFLLFCVNVFFLVPYLLLKKKYLYYYIFAVLLILAAVAFKLFLQSGEESIGAPMMGPPPDGFRHGNPFPGNHTLFMLFINSLIICVLIIGASTAIELVFKWLSEEKLRKDIEKEQLKTSLALLRHQVSPHFFMNTLNNIHSLISIDSEKAQGAVERLSTLMRYLLYDSAQNTIELKKEIEFINSFISLMKLRHSDEVEVIVNFPEQIPNIQIPPMLFISLLENAFKHGVNYPLKSYIYFELRILENSMRCIIKNSKHKTLSNYQGEYSGIGLDNIKKSLKLLYEDNYQLSISDKENEFEVNLNVPL